MHFWLLGGQVGVNSEEDSFDKISRNVRIYPPNNFTPRNRPIVVPQNYKEVYCITVGKSLLKLSQSLRKWSSELQ